MLSKTVKVLQQIARSTAPLSPDWPHLQEIPVCKGSLGGGGHLRKGESQEVRGKLGSVAQSK